MTLGIDTRPKTPPAAYGCGDYWAKVVYDQADLDRERRQERMERFCPHDCSLPAGHKGPFPPYPWQIERAERGLIAREAVRLGFRGQPDIDRVVDLTLFARRFERWAEEGFSI